MGSKGILTPCTSADLLSVQRRGWDSNPRALADKRFSRPPRYDHFDTSPGSFCAFPLGQRKDYSSKKEFQCQQLFCKKHKKFYPQKTHVESLLIHGSEKLPQHINLPAL